MELALQLVEACRAHGISVVTAESCTGGMLAARITDIPGASEVFPGGVVVYANNMKRELLRVPQELLERSGAVSGECAAAMAQGARELLGGTLAVAITGIAGPGGGSIEKPVGLVWFGLAAMDGVLTEECRFQGARAAIRAQAVEHALKLLLYAVGLNGRCHGVR